MPFVPTPSPDPSQIVWKTKAGENLTMREISNNHMTNIIRLLRRRALDNLTNGYSALGILRTFEAEAKRRGMNLERI